MCVWRRSGDHLPRSSLLLENCVIGRVGGGYTEVSDQGCMGGPWKKGPGITRSLPWSRLGYPLTHTYIAKQQWHVPRRAFLLSLTPGRVVCLIQSCGTGGVRGNLGVRDLDGETAGNPDFRDPMSQRHTLPLPRATQVPTDPRGAAAGTRPTAGMWAKE